MIHLEKNNVGPVLSVKTSETIDKNNNKKKKYVCVRECVCVLDGLLLPCSCDKRSDYSSIDCSTGERAWISASAARCNESHLKTLGPPVGSYIRLCLCSSGFVIGSSRWFLMVGRSESPYSQMIIAHCYWMGL